MPSRQMCGLGLLFALAAAGPVAAQSKEDATELEPIIVTPPQINPLDASLERLRTMMEEAPDLGSAVPFREDWTDTVANWFVPPNPTAEVRLEKRIADDWKWAERGPENDAFR